MKKKEHYIEPNIELIQLDATISLILASDADPMGEPEWNTVSDVFKQLVP